MKKRCLFLIAVFFYGFFIAFGSGFPASAEPVEVVVEEMEQGMEAGNRTENVEVGSFPSWVDESALAESYIKSVMPHAVTPRISRFSGLSLSSPSCDLYLMLREQIVAVASGERTSTEFTFAYNDIFQTTFTAEELHVDTILKEDDDGKLRITEEAKGAALAAITDSRNKIEAASIVRCLLNDCPYELYWYNKAEDGGVNIAYVTSAYSATSGSISVKGSIVVSMSVSADYATCAYSDGDLTFAQYEVDRGYGESVRFAVENAARILDESSAMNDYEKLVYYKDTICTLTDYNESAENGGIYGDPWQIVWVFDGKPNTTVVCEGYAKAFQYLAGIGTVSAKVICVQGKTTAAHMWNVVNINNHNYLADLTACDIGEDMFLKGYSGGDITAGYFVGSKRYVYNEELVWNTEDLTLAAFDYTDWVAATTTAPAVALSSNITFPDCQLAARVDSTVPVDALIISTGVEERTVVLEQGTALFSMDADAEICFSGVIDGVTTPTTESTAIMVSHLHGGGILTVPSGCVIEAGAFSGIGAEEVVLRGNNVHTDAFTDCENLRLVIIDEESVIAAGAFGNDVTFLVQGVESWFDTGYRFVVARQGS